MGRASFSQAIAHYPYVRCDERGYLALEKLERIILDHCPKTSSEAVAMLNVAIPDISSGGRSDGRDVKALRSIRTLLAAQP